MQLRQALVLVLAALVAHIDAAPAPCDGTPTTEPTHMAPPTYVPPTTTIRSHHFHPHPTTVSVTDTVTDTVTRWSTVTPTRTRTHVWTTNTPVWTSSSAQWTSSWTPSATPSSSSGSGGQCNTGPIHCCDSVQDASSPDASNILKGLSLGVPIAAGVPVGLNCSPLSVLGLGTAGNW